MGEQPASPQQQRNHPSSRDLAGSLCNMADFNEAILAAEEAELRGEVDLPALRAHLAVCLCAHELDRARFLWKRSEAHQGDAEFAALWAVGRAMWKKDWPGAHQALESAGAVVSGEAATHLGALRGELRSSM